MTPARALGWIEQKNGRCCGQVAVAVLTGVPLDQIKTEIGKRGGTTTRHLVRALRAHGFICPDKCSSAARFIESPEVCLAQLRRSGYSGWHWIAICDGIVYDGNRSGPLHLPDYERFQKSQGWRITSYLPVSPTANCRAFAAEKGEL